jgi:hypothetical protein
VTPEGFSYESDYETLTPAPSVNAISYKADDMDTREPGVKIKGLQFYTDVEARGEYSGYYKFDVIETYEFHTYTQDVHWFNNGSLSEIPSDSIIPICYVTRKVSDIFLLSTKSLEGSSVEDLPLHFVSNQTQRLKHGYSTQIRLLSLSPSAYDYWKSQKSILEESGGLFETQPPKAIGNIYNTQNPDERVLGYFGASAVSTRRIFVPRGTMSEFDITPYCEPAVVPSMYLQRLYRYGIGVVFFTYAFDPLGVWSLHFVDKLCFNCLAQDGSTTEKPEFWEE